MLSCGEVMITQNNISSSNIVQVLGGHCGTQFAQQNKESLLIDLLFDQAAALRWYQCTLANTGPPHICQLNIKPLMDASFK